MSNISLRDAMVVLAQFTKDPENDELREKCVKAVDKLQWNDRDLLIDCIDHEVMDLVGYN